MDYRIEIEGSGEGWAWTGYRGDERCAGPAMGFATREAARVEADGWLYVQRARASLVAMQAAARRGRDFVDAIRNSQVWLSDDARDTPAWRELEAAVDAWDRATAVFTAGQQPQVVVTLDRPAANAFGRPE